MIALRRGALPSGDATWSRHFLAWRGAGNRGVDRLRGTAGDARESGIPGRKLQNWVIPPGSDEEFIACREEALDAYERPCDPQRPALCMDAQPMQLAKQTRERIPSASSRPPIPESWFD